MVMTMNIIRMSGGLGSQMFQYALYLKLKSMGKEVKFDDINEYRGEKARPIMLAVFGIEYPRATWDEITAFTDGSMDLLKRLRRKIFGRKAIEYEEQGFYDPNVLNFDSMYLRGNFQSEKYFQDIEEEVRKLYRFSTLEDMRLPERLYKATKACLDGIESSESVGLHMYSSDSRVDGELYDGICTGNYYKGAVRFIQDKVPDAKFYIFSNEPKWVRGWVVDLIQSQIQEGMSPSQVKEMEKRFVMVEANTEYTGYLDMMLMSKCIHNIISNSSFRWWSASINDHPEKVVVAPDRWSSDKEGNEIYTAGMTLVNEKGRVNYTIHENSAVK